MPRKPSAHNALKRISNNVRHTIGANVKNRRLTLGWSQQELADRFGVSRAAVSQYEIGTGEINAGDLPRMAGILGIELVDFFQAPSPVSAPLRSAQEKNAPNSIFPNAQKSTFSEDIESPDLMQDDVQDDLEVEAMPAFLPPALNNPDDTFRKTTLTVDNGDGTRYIIGRDNRVLLVDNRNSTAKAMGHFAGNAKMPVVTQLLGSILALSAEDHETLRRIIAVMQSRVTADPDKEGTTKA